MLSDNPKGSWLEKREYPRISAKCPVRYKVVYEENWHEGILLDYSATGARIQSEELILKGTHVIVEVIQGTSKNVPLFSVEAIVVRFSLNDEHQFEIGCEFLKPISSLTRK